MISTTKKYDCTRPYLEYRLDGRMMRYYIPAPIRKMTGQKHTQALENWEGVCLDDFRRTVNADPLATALDQKIQHGLRKQSIPQYRRALRRFSEHLQTKNLQFNTITRKQAADFLRHVCDTSGAPTANNTCAYLCALYSMLMDDEQITSNPFLRQKSFKHDVRRNVALTETERAQLENELDAETLRLARFVFWTLIRPGELEQLTWSCVDLDAGIIIIPAHVSKTRCAGRVTLPNKFAEELREHVKQTGPAPDARLFRNAHRLSDRHRETVRRIGLNSAITLYSWKHSGAIALYNATHDVLLVSKHCRHAGVETTMQYLRHLGVETMDRVRAWSV